MAILFTSHDVIMDAQCKIKRKGNDKKLFFCFYLRGFFATFSHCGAFVLRAILLIGTFFVLMGCLFGLAPPEISAGTKGVNPCSNMGGIILGRNIHPACGMYCAKRRACLGGFEGMSRGKIFLNGAIWCVLVYIWDQILSLKNFKNYHFLSKNSRLAGAPLEIW